MKALLEFPLGWFTNPIDGVRHKEFWIALAAVLLDLNYHVELVPIPFGADSCPRISDEKDQLYVAWHGRRLPDDAVYNTVVYVKEAPVPPYYIVDGHGYSGWSDPAVYSEEYLELAAGIDPDVAETAVLALRSSLQTLNVSKYPQPSDRTIDAENYVFLALQTQDDPVASLSPISGLQLIRWCVEFANLHSTRLVIKRHPLCRSPVIEMALESAAQDPWVVISRDSIHSLISNAQSTVTVNSGVGLESLLYGKPTYCTGKSEWEIVANKVFAREDLREAFVNPKFDKFAFAWLYVLIKNYWVRADDAESIVQKFQRIQEKQDKNFNKSDRLYRLRRTLLEQYAKQESTRRSEVHLNQIIDGQTREIAELQDQLQASEFEAGQKQELAEKMELETTDLTQQIQAARSAMEILTKKNRELESCLEKICRSRSWKLLTLFRKTRAWN